MEGAISGSFTLRNRYRRPTVQGAISVSEGTIYVDELQRAAGVVNLSDPFLLDAGIAVDTTALSSQPIFAGLTNPFFDNLRADVDLTVPRGNWLRSIDTNAEILGDLLVLYDRSVDDFVLVGELSALRGSHRVLGRSFELDGGTVNFIGRPGMNPDLNIQASTRIRRPDDSPFRVNAEVGGSLIRPVVTLTTEETGLAEEDLVSYLVFGQPSTALGGSGRSQVGGQRGFGTVAQGAATFIGGAFANQFGTAIAQELGALSLDYVSVQQGGAAQSLGGGTFVGDTQVELGRYVGDDLFLIMVLRPFDTGPQDQNTVAGVRVEWALTDDYNSEIFFEDRFLRSSSALLGSSSGLLENQRVLGLFLFREWGYGSGPDSPQDR
jgi:translocation and assembly module TamB